MEPSDENAATATVNGGPGDHPQKLGLGFQSTDPVDPDPHEEDEALYENRFSQELEGLILGEHGSGGRKRLVNHDEEGFDQEEDLSEGFDSGNGFNGDNISYPVRPDAEDCPYYMRNGSCKFGSSCKFNHPLRRKNQFPKAAKDKEGYLERPVQIECKYHMTSGGCKYGNACKYSHNGTKTPATPVNFLGLPIRPGGTECSFYMRTGSCKYGSSCKFNHPEPTAVAGADASSGYVNGGALSMQAASQTAISPWSSPRAFNGNDSVLPMIYSPANGVPAPNLEWNSYQALVYPATERRLPTPPAFRLNNPTETNFYTQHRPVMPADDFPERPGEPECSYFMKTGDCKYRSACKFHHPRNRTKSTGCTLSDKGLPLRPDQQVCSYYTRYGLCKYGPACRYDHPVTYDNSASSTVSTRNGAPVFVSSDAADVGGNEKNAIMYQNG